MLPKPKTMYSHFPEYNWENEDMLTEGCNIDHYDDDGNWSSYGWNTDLSLCLY